MTTQETYADKISKLLRKAESTTPEEAELLFAKAQELMAKYAIDEAMLNAAKGTDREREPIVSEEFVIVGLYRAALLKLSWYVMLNNGLRGIQLSDPGWRKVGDKVYKETMVLVGVGYQSDISNAKQLATSLEIQALRAESQWWRENSNLYASDGRSARLIRRGFIMAFAEGANVKMREATARGKAAAEEEHGRTGVELVLRDKSLAVKDEFDKLFPSVRSVKSRRDQGDEFARKNGFAAGQRADVGQPGLRNSRKQLN